MWLAVHYTPSFSLPLTHTPGLSQPNCRYVGPIKLRLQVSAAAGSRGKGPLYSLCKSLYHFHTSLRCCSDVSQAFWPWFKCEHNAAIEIMAHTSCPPESASSSGFSAPSYHLAPNKNRKKVLLCASLICVTFIPNLTQDVVQTYVPLLMQPIQSTFSQQSDTGGPQSGSQVFCFSTSTQWPIYV